MASIIVTPDDLRAGIAALPARAYLDANFLVTAHFGLFKTPYLLAELQAHPTQLYISSLAIDEAWWALLREWLRRDRNVRLTGHYLKTHRDLLCIYHPELERFTNEVMAWSNVVFVAVHRPRASSTTVRALIRQSLDLLNSEQLAPRDAFHLAILRGLGIADVVTEDRDFDSVDGLTLYRFH